MDGDKKPENMDTQLNEDNMDEFVDDTGEDIGFDDGNFDDSNFDENPADGNFDDGSLSDEEWDTYDDDFSEEGGFDEHTPQKKKVSNKLIIGGALMLGIVIAGYQLVSSSGQEQVVAPSTQTPPQPTPTQNANAIGNVQPSATTDVPQANLPQAYNVKNLYREDFEQPLSKDIESSDKPGMLNNPDQLENIQNASHEDGAYEYEYVYEDEFGNVVGEGTEDINVQDGQPDQDVTAPLTPIPAETDTVSPFGNDVVETVDIEEASSEMPRMPGKTAESNAQQQNDNPFADDVPAWENNSEEVPVDTSGWDKAKTSSAPQTKSSAGLIRNEDISMLSNQLDTLMGRLDDIENRIGDINSLKSSLNAIENRLTKLEKSRNSSPSSSSYASSPSSNSTAAEPARTTRTAPVTAAKWTLKAAQPGQAMVTKEGSSDVISITPGQSLPGIGIVKSITMENGRWVVSGTNGQIRQ